MAHVLVFTNYKGGISKTTSVWNVGADLANRKKKTLLIDLDPQHNLTQAHGITEISVGTYNVLIDKAGIEPIQFSKNLFILPGSLELKNAESMLAGAFQREYVLAKAIEKVKDDYDYILIDCPPSLGLLTVNGIMAGDFYFVPVEPEMFAYNGIQVLSATMEEMEIEFDHLFFARVDNRLNIHKDMMDKIKKTYPEKVMNTIIGTNTKLKEACVVKEDIHRYDKNSSGSKQYKALTREIIKMYN